jgi:hypothetical protein
MQEIPEKMGLLAPGCTSLHRIIQRRGRDSNPRGRKRPTGFRDLAEVKASERRLEIGVFLGRSELQTSSKPSKRQMKGGVNVTVDVTPGE